jgi:hypothetical protein
MRADIQDAMAQSGGIRFKVLSDKTAEWRCSRETFGFRKYSKFAHTTFTVRAGQVLDVTIPWQQFNGSGINTYGVPFVKNGNFIIEFQSNSLEAGELKIYDMEIYKRPLASDERTGNNGPVINNFVTGDDVLIGIDTIGYTAGASVEARFLYEFSASDPDGNWQTLIHEIKYYNYVFDISLDLRELQSKTIKYITGFIAELTGPCEHSWYILDKAGNKSQTVRKTIVHGNKSNPDILVLPYPVKPEAGYNIFVGWRIEGEGGGTIAFPSQTINGIVQKVLNIQLDNRRGWVAGYYRLPTYLGTDAMLEQSTGIKFKAYSGESRSWLFIVGIDGENGWTDYSSAFSTKANQVVEITIPWSKLRKYWGPGSFNKKYMGSLQFRLSDNPGTGEINIFDMEIY